MEEKHSNILIQGTRWDNCIPRRVNTDSDDHAITGFSQSHGKAGN